MLSRTSKLVRVRVQTAARLGAVCFLSASGAPAAAQTTAAPASAIPVTPAGVPVVGPLLGPPRVTVLFGQGDGNGFAGDTPIPSFVLDPIRLGLFAADVPVGAADPACRGSLEAAGNATAASGGFALQHAAELRLIPHLTLAGFSRGGCSVDSGVGAALVCAVPIRKDIWFVASAGILKLPHAGPNGASVTTSQFRADIVFARPAGRSLAVGISNRGLSFGGTL
jgi:hypothetical protein